METQLLIAGILFTLGLVGLMVRRNLLFMLMSLEIMMNAAAFAFISAGARWMQPDGQVMFIFILTVAAVEVSVALALVILMHKHFKTIDTASPSPSKGGEEEKYKQTGLSSSLPLGEG